MYATLTLMVAAVLLTLPAAGRAQAQDWFIPGQQKGSPQRPAGAPAAKPAPHPPAPAAAPQPLVQVPLQPSVSQQDAEQQAPDSRGQFQLPPAPDLPALAKGAGPPAAVLGVLGVPDVMRAATAAQAVEKVIGERRDKLNQDAQKEQGAWRDLQQALGNQRSTLSPDQIRNREKELQDRITNSQRQFRDRNRLIQESAQYCLAQIERTLVAVIRQVADSHGMNLVLHRAQVALNVAEFDITDQVTDELNKLLPSVIIPPEGAEPPRLAAAAPAPDASAAPTATAATPASAAAGAPAKPN